MNKLYFFKLTTIFIVFSLLMLNVPVFGQGAAINTTGSAADVSAILDISSNNSGILIPRMTKSQKDGISNPANGLLIYQTDNDIGFWYYDEDATAWKQIGSGGTSGSTVAGGSTPGNTLFWDGTDWVESPNIYNEGASIGIGTNTPDPSARLEVADTNAGFLIPRLTTAQRDAIQSPAVGLQIFNISSKCFEYYVNNKWRQSSCDCGDILVDTRDKNVYNTVQIGNQCWMKENLKYVVPNSWCYNNDTANHDIYGRLYTWDAAMAGFSSSDSIPSGVQGVCPSGWHLPSDAEWKQLEEFLGMDINELDIIGWRGTDQGSQLKEAGTFHWNSPNTGATNSSGFTALPSGYRDISGTYDYLGSYSYWWSTTIDNSNAWRRTLYCGFEQVVRRASSKDTGFSARCLKD